MLTKKFWGFEIWSQPNLGVWTDNGDGSYTLVGDGSFQPISCGTVVPANSLVYYQVTVDELSGSGNLKVFSGGVSTPISSAGTYTGQFVSPGGTQIGFARGYGTINATISNVVFLKESPFNSIIKSPYYTPETFNDVIRTFT